MEALADMMDRLLTPEDGGDSGDSGDSGHSAAGKAVIRQLAAAAHAAQSHFAPVQRCRPGPRSSNTL